MYNTIMAIEIVSGDSNPPITFTAAHKISAYAKDGIINGYSNGDGSFRFQPGATPPGPKPLR